MAELLVIIMFVTLCAALLMGFPVAFVLAGISVLFACLGSALDVFDLQTLSALPGRLYGIMTNELLLAVPLFIFMGVTLERARIAERLLKTMAGFFSSRPSGLGIAVMLVGAILAASTGIVGATVVTMGMISLPVMLKNKYDPAIAAGTICASGTLGQIIPPSIVLILLGDQIANAYQTAQLKLGNFAPSPVSVADIFMGAIVPGLVLVACYILWLCTKAFLHPHAMPPAKKVRHSSLRQVLMVLLPPIALIVIVLGSILAGVATATESAAVGAAGALFLAWRRNKLSRKNLRHIVRETTKSTAMVFTILIGAAFFTVVFRGLGGDDLVHEQLSNLPGGLFHAMVIVMLAMFLLGFFLDFIEIIFVVVPIVAPVLLLLGADPIWLAIMIAINLQTSFLTPPFGFALFYLRGVAPESVSTHAIYKGVAPFILVQLLVLSLLAFQPNIATWLPEQVYGTRFEPAPAELNVIESYDIDF